MTLKSKAIIKWSPRLAYVVGLIATDGCLYNDGRHIAFVSKDLQLIRVFVSCLGLKNKIAKKYSGFDPNSFAYWVQFGDIRLYKFLLSIGLYPAKSKTIARLDIPNKYFFDFLRGEFDGDGTFYSYWDKRWASSFMYYLNFVSASLPHLIWLRKTIYNLLRIKGHLKTKLSSRTFKLCYAKSDSKIIIRKMYYSKYLPEFERKRKKIYNALELDRKGS